jgi:hypothetical protein
LLAQVRVCLGWLGTLRRFNHEIKRVN